MCQNPLLTRQKRHSGRLGWLVDASRAICEPPSWGNEAGEPGAPGSSSEWSRGESERGGREGPGRCSVRLRQRSEMSRRWVIKHRRRSPNPRMLVGPNMGHLWAMRNGNYYVTGKAGEWQLSEHLCTWIGIFFPPQINHLIRWIFVMIQWKVECNKTGRNGWDYRVLHFTVWSVPLVPSAAESHKMRILPKCSRVHTLVAFYLIFKPSKIRLWKHFCMSQKVQNGCQNIDIVETWRQTWINCGFLCDIYERGTIKTFIQRPQHHLNRIVSFSFFALLCPIMTKSMINIVSVMQKQMLHYKMCMLCWAEDNYYEYDSY